MQTPNLLFCSVSEVEVLISQNHCTLSMWMFSMLRWRLWCVKQAIFGLYLRMHSKEELFLWLVCFYKLSEKELKKKKHNNKHTHT